MTPKPKTLAQVEEQRPAVMQDEATVLIAQAIEKNVPVESLERLLAMRRELKAEKSKGAYDQAMALFQSECPTIKKTKEVKNDYGKILYSYAPIESIVDQVKNALKNNGFSYATSMNLLDNGVKVCIKVTHAQGHSEETCMTVPLGARTGIMSASQQVAAATTFAKRYAFCNAFGILTGDEDNDGATIQTTSPSPIRPAVPLPIRMITDIQKGEMISLLGKLKKSSVDLNKVVKAKFKIVDDYKKLTAQQADQLIEYMRDRVSKLPVGNFESADNVPDVAEMSEQELDDIEQGIEQQKLA